MYVHNYYTLLSPYIQGCLNIEEEITNLKRSDSYILVAYHLVGDEKLMYLAGCPGGYALHIILCAQYRVSEYYVFILTALCAWTERLQQTS